jgi:hypothetical protein
VLSTPVALLFDPVTVAPEPLALLPEPVAVLFCPPALAFAPVAVASKFDAVEELPVAVARNPFALAPGPQAIAVGSPDAVAPVLPAQTNCAAAGVGERAKQIARAQTTPKMLASHLAGRISPRLNGITQLLPFSNSSKLPYPRGTPPHPIE